MKNERSFFLAIAITLVLVASNLFDFTVSTSRFNESYPATVCPPNISGLSTAISLNSSEMSFRKTGTKSMKTSTIKISRYAVASQSAVI